MIKEVLTTNGDPDHVGPVDEGSANPQLLSTEATTRILATRLRAEREYREHARERFVTPARPSTPSLFDWPAAGTWLVSVEMEAVFEEIQRLHSVSPNEALQVLEGHLEDALNRYKLNHPLNIMQAGRGVRCEQIDPRQRLRNLIKESKLWQKIISWIVELAGTSGRREMSIPEKLPASPCAVAQSQADNPLHSNSPLSSFDEATKNSTATSSTFCEYPSWRYHWSGEKKIVQTGEEEAALGDGWADTPAAFDPYKSPRSAGTAQGDPEKWIDAWPVPGLSPALRMKVRAIILKANEAFWRGPDTTSTASDCMKSAFSDTATVLYEARLLTADILRKELRELVWDSAIAGGWYRCASEAPSGIFPKQIGHYWVWFDETRDWRGLFRAEIAEWLAKLLEKAAPHSATTASASRVDDLLAPTSLQHSRPDEGPGPETDIEYLIKDKPSVGVPAAARYLNLSDGHIRRLVKAGKLTRVGQGKLIRVSTSSLRKYKGT